MSLMGVERQGFRKNPLVAMWLMGQPRGGDCVVGKIWVEMMEAGSCGM